MTLLDGSAVEQARAIRNREVSSEELVRGYLARIEARDRDIRAFVEVAPERALRDARRKDAAVRSAAQLPPFHGVPMGIKDLNLVRGFGTRGGSRALRWFRWSPIDDYTAASLRRAGFVFIGKLATSEIGAMPVTEPDIHPPTRNPWNLAHTPGGSSGGSAAAVSARFLPVAQGSDGAGSIRIPSAFCHLFGLKPSRGRLANQFGVRDPRILYTCGPITRTVGDAAAMLDVMLDRGSRSVAPLSDGSFAALAERQPAKLRIRVATRSPWGATDPEIEAATLRVARALEEAGHSVEPAPSFDTEFEEALPLWQWLMGATPVALRYVQPVTRWLAEPGRRMLRADRDALHDRLSKRVFDAFGDADLWVTPTVVVPPPRVGAWSALPPAAAFREAALLGAFTAMFNVTGQPAASVPVGFMSSGLPIGVQLAGRLYEEATILAVARELERSFPWSDPRPPP